MNRFGSDCRNWRRDVKTNLVYFWGNCSGGFDFGHSMVVEDREIGCNTGNSAVVGCFICVLDIFRSQIEKELIT